MKNIDLGRKDTVEGKKAGKHRKREKKIGEKIERTQPQAPSAEPPSPGMPDGFTTKEIPKTPPVEKVTDQGIPPQGEWYAPPHFPPYQMYPYGYPPPQVSEGKKKKEGYPHPWFPPPPPGFYPPYPYGYPGIPGQEFQPPIQPGMAPQEGFDFSPGGLFEQHESEAREYSGTSESYWRADLKWIFGIVSAVFLFIALSLAGAFRVTAPGAARDSLLPLVQGATRVEAEVRDAYQSLRKKAKKNPNGSVTLRDIGIEISIDSEMISSLNSEELADKVSNLLAKKIYESGFSDSIPLPRAYGVGEERAKALCLTLFSAINRRTHKNLLIPIIVFAGIAFGFGILSAVFSRGWGKARTVGLILILGSLPGSLMIRAAFEFLWKPGSAGVFSSALGESLSTTAAFALPFYDIALAAGAIVLLAGIIGGLVAKRAIERVPPFIELGRGEEFNIPPNRASADSSEMGEKFLREDS